MADISYQDYAVQMAGQYGVPVDLFLWQIDKESSWDPNAKNPKSTARGITQFTNPTAKWWGVNQDDPYSSIEGAASYMQYLFGKTGSWIGALNSYGTIHNDPKKTAEAQAILNANSTSTKYDIYDSPGLTARIPREDDIEPGHGAGTSELNSNIPGKGDNKGNSIFSGINSVILALIGIVLLILAVLNTDGGKKAVKMVVTKGIA